MNHLDIDNSLNDIGLGSNEQPFLDTITSIQFLPGNSNFLACSSWDGTIRVYEIVSNYRNFLVQKILFSYSSPIFSISWKNDGSVIFASCLDDTIQAFDVQSQKCSKIGEHNDTIPNAIYINEINAVMSVSSDKTLKFWQQNNNSPVLAISSDLKFFNAAIDYPLLGTINENDMVWCVDIAQLTNLPNSKITQSDFSTNSLSSSLNCISLKESSFIVGSTNGRANISNITKTYNKCTFKTELSYKCHKVEETNLNQAVLYSVNAVGFHPSKKNIVYTAGGDGVASFWEITSKIKLESFSFNKKSITIAKISNDGKFFAYGLGYDWSEGVNSWGDKNIKPQLFVHVMKDSDLIKK